MPWTLIAPMATWQVTQEKRWNDVIKRLKMRDAAHYAYSLRQHYSKLLLQYEIMNSTRGTLPGRRETDDARQVAAGTSSHSLSLLLQDIEERIPWEALGNLHSTWEDARPAWLAVVVSAGGNLEGNPIGGVSSQLRAMAQAIATLESVLDDAVLVPEWRSRMRGPWIKQLVMAKTTAELKRLVIQLEDNVKWSSFDQSDDDDDEREVMHREPRQGSSHAQKSSKEHPARGHMTSGEGKRKQRGLDGEEVGATKYTHRDKPREDQRLLPAAADDELSRDERKAARDAARAAQLNKAKASGGLLGMRCADDSRGGDDFATFNHSTVQGDCAGWYGPPGAPAPGSVNRKRDSDAAEGAADCHDGMPIAKIAKRTRHSIKQDANVGSTSLRGQTSPDDNEYGEEGYAEIDAEDEAEERLLTIDGFLKQAVAYKSLVLGSAASKASGSASLDGDAAPDKVEHLFWRLAQGLETSVRDERGEGKREPDAINLSVALPGKDGGGGFAAPGEGAEEPYASSPWSTRQMLRQPDCLLSHLGDQTVEEQRVLSFGMLFGTQRWKVHQHFMYGLSYLHVGAPRSWYALSGLDAEALHALLASESSGDDATRCAFQLPSLLPPSRLCSHELQVSHALQLPGEFVLTMPRAFHMSFNHGFNAVESATFATVDWLPHGTQAAAMHRRLKQKSTVCYEEVVAKAAQHDPTVRAAIALMEPLLQISSAHAEQLAALKVKGVTRFESARYLCDGGAEPTPECAECKQPCWLLCVRCTCAATEGVAHCAEHALAAQGNTCTCSFDAKVVQQCLTQEQLHALKLKLQGKLAQREDWLENAARALDSSPPTLAHVETLLAEAQLMQIFEPPGERLQRLQRQGGEWQALANNVLNSRAAYGTKEVIELMETGAALPLLLPSLDKLKQLLDTAHAWQNQARELLAASTPTGRWLPQRCVPMEQLAGLLTKPEAQQLKLPEADGVRDELGKLLWVSRAHGMVDTTPPMSELRELLADAEARGLMHLTVAEQLQRRVNSGLKWMQRASNALRRRTGLPLLNTLLHEASAIPIKLEQMEEVTQRIRQAKAWVGRAKVALSKMASVDEMRKLQGEAEALDVTVPEETIIADKVSLMDRWLKKASTAFIKRGCEANLLQVLASSQALELSGIDEDGNPSTAGLACAYCTGNDAATLNRFMVGCDTCERWYHGPCVSMSKAAADSIDTYLCPECASLANLPYAFGPPVPSLKRTRRPRLRLVCSLLDEAEEIGVEMPEVKLMRDLQAEAVTWQEKAREMQAKEGAIDAVELDALLLEGEACEVEPEALGALRKLSAQCISWRQRALAVLNGEHPLEPDDDHEAHTEEEAEGQETKREAKEATPPPNSMPGVEALLAEANYIELACPEEQPLRAMLDAARAWQSAARIALEEPHLIAPLSIEQTLPNVDTAAKSNAVAAAAEAPGATAPAHAVERSEAAAEETERLLAQLEGLPLQLPERGRLRRELGRKRWLLWSRQKLVEALQGEPLLELLKWMAGEATALGLGRLPEVVMAQQRIDEAEAWLSKCNKVLAKEADVRALLALAGEAEALKVRLQQLSDVQARIEGAHGWAERAREALARRATLVEIQDLLRQAELAAVPMKERSNLLQAEQLARWWRERATHVFVKRGSSLDMCSAVGGDGHYELLGDDGEWLASLACAYCKGDSPLETSHFMVGCDTCERWYHGPCVSMSKAAADSIDTYLCPECASLANLPYAFGPPVPSLKRTRRPRLRLVCSLLDEAEEIGVEMPEVKLMRDLQAEAVTWQEKAREMQAKEGAIDAVELDALLLEGEACEVEPEALGALRQMQMRKGVTAEEHAREVSDKKWKLCKGTSSTDDRERLAEGRLDTLAGIAAQAEATHLPSVQRLVLACRAEHRASDEWRGTMLGVLRQKQPPLVELQPVPAAADEQVCLELDAVKLMAARRELLSQFPLNTRLLETTATILDETKSAAATAATSFTAGDVPP